MENEIITQNKKFLEEINSYTIKQKIDAIDSKDVEQTFRIRYRNEFFVNRFEELKKNSFTNTNQSIIKLFEDANNVIGLSHEFQPELYGFYKAEKAEMETFIASKDTNPENLAKANSYLAYLVNNENNWWRMDDMFKMISYKNTYPSIAPLAKAKLKNEFIDIPRLDEKQSELFQMIDRTYLLGLLSKKNQDMKETYIERFPAWFDFDYYKNPSIFVEFPKEKTVFHKVLKSWIIDQVETRKKVFEWEFFPPEYQYILDYANSLLPLAEPEPVKVLNTKPMQAKLEQASDYPKHIFANDKAYQMFSLLMKHIKTHAAISFVFRTMAEKEKPPLILVNDTPFRNWFNEQQGYIQLETYTKTYENSKNEDRIASYNIAKELIMSN